MPFSFLKKEGEKREGSLQWEVKKKKKTKQKQAEFDDIV